MASDDQSDPRRSGSRWEPTDSTPPGDDAPTEPIPARASAAEPDAGTTAEQPPVTGTAAAGSHNPLPPGTAPRGPRMIGIPVASAVAAGLIVAGGLGGYALGAATTTDDVTPVSDGSGTQLPGFPDDPDGDGFHGDFDDDAPDFDDDGPGFDDDSGSDTDDSGEET